MVFIFKLLDATACVEGMDFTDNDAYALYTDNDSSTAGVFTNCKFGAGTPFSEYYEFDFEFKNDESGIIFEDCTFNNSPFNDKKAATFFGGNVSNTVASVFGEGSLTMIVAILALVASVVSIFFIVDMKKKLVSAAANNTAKNKDEE
jgi:hypothetical protein